MWEPEAGWKLLIQKHWYPTLAPLSLGGEARRMRQTELKHSRIYGQQIYALHRSNEGLFIWVSLSLSSWRWATGTEIFIFALGMQPKRGEREGGSLVLTYWTLFWIFLATQSSCFHDVDMKCDWQNTPPCACQTFVCFSIMHKLAQEACGCLWRLAGGLHETLRSNLTWQHFLLRYVVGGSLFFCFVFCHLSVYACFFFCKFLKSLVHSAT